MEQLGEWLDASKIDVLNLCPRKYQYRHEFHLVPIRSEDFSESTALTFGHAIHAALATYYMGDGFIDSTCPCPTFEGCQFCKGGMIPRMAALFLINYPEDPTDERDPRTRARGIEILYAYVNKWRREPFEVVGVEIPFAIPFNGITYIGRIDLLVKEDGKLKPWDHKTASRFGMFFDQGFKQSGQLTGYMQSVHEITGMPVTEAGINAIRVTTKIDDDSFMRLTTMRTPEDFDEWRKHVNSAIERIRLYRNNDFWPKHAPFACTAYNRQCEYYSLCISGRETRQLLMESQFEPIPWTPVMND